jgi:hypothetical protein
LEDRNVIDERPRWCGATVEREHVAADRRDSELEERIVLEPGADGRDRRAVPPNVHERAGLERRPAEGAGVEEIDRVGLAGDGGEGLRGRERPGEGVFRRGRSEEGHRVAGVGVGLEEEDGRIEGAACRARADPVRVARIEAEIVALGEPFEAAIDDEVLALVTTGESDLQIALASVDSGGRVGHDEVLRLRVRLCSGKYRRETHH